MDSFLPPLGLADIAVNPQLSDLVNTLNQKTLVNVYSITLGVQGARVFEKRDVRRDLNCLTTRTIEVKENTIPRQSVFLNGKGGCRDGFG